MSPKCDVLTSLIFEMLIFLFVSELVDSRHISNRTVQIHEISIVDTEDPNCLHACLHECMDWGNASFTSEDCLIPCAIYTEESERIMNEENAIGTVPSCNDTRGAAVGLDNAAKPEQVSIRMVRKSPSNITEVWWKPVSNAANYTVQIWCQDNSIFEEITWLTWYAYQDRHDFCPSGTKARVAAQNEAGFGEYSEFSDKLDEDSTNSTAINDFLLKGDGRISRRVLRTRISR